MLQPGQYRHSPAFDFAPDIEEAGHRALVSVNSSRPAPLRTHSHNATAFCLRSLKHVKSSAIRWPDEFRDAGVAPRDIHTLAGYFSVADEAEQQQVQVINAVLDHDQFVELNEAPQAIATDAVML